MKSKGILNTELAKLVAHLGHGDMIAIVDRGFPFPTSTDVICIDLAISKDLPTVGQVLDIILEELVLEKKFFAKETLDTSRNFYDNINGIFENHGVDIPEEILPHMDFKEAILKGGFRDKEIRAYIRTGEFTFFGNIVIVAGVDFS